MRRYAAILPTLTLLFLTASSFAANGKIKLGMGVGSLNDRVFRLENFTVPIGYYETSTQLDSANIRNQLPRGTTWLHRRLNQNYVFFKMHNDDIIGGQPDNWNTAYDWVSGSYGAFVTGATNSTLTRSGRGTSGAPYTLGINLAAANDWTGVQSFVGFDLKQAAGSDEVQFRSPVLGASWTFTMPPDNGDANEFLQTDGNGTATWEPEADGVIGNEVTGASADSILKRTGAGTTVAPYTLRFDTTRALTLTNNFEVRDTVKMGDGTNYTMFETDGSMRMVGNATVWDELRITPGMIENKGPTYVGVDPSTGIGIGTFLLEFEKNDSAMFIVQLPHSYKVGSNIYAHIHWTAGESGDTEEGNSVGWKIAYSWANIGSAFPALTSLSLADTVSGDDWTHQVTTDAQISGSGKSISSILMCNIKRSDTGSDDTWIGTASGQLPMLLEIDFHYEMDTVGSRGMSTK